ncbi:MAG: DUF4238 domain-containing protein [Candidatus Obscuribacter sp.]|nr:DUF4238 domain-containing protein [Candidatus Obscuribacter sp.]
MIEKKLGDIEAQGARIIERLLQLVRTRITLKSTDEFTVPENQRRNLAFLVSLQLLRTKESREFARSVYTQLGTSLMKATAQDVSPGIDPSRLDMEYSEDYIKWQHLQSVFEMAPDLAKTLLTRLFYVGVNRTSTPLWTSDHPVVRDAQPVQKKVPFDGLKSPFMKVVYPISPEVALLFVDPTGYSHMRDWHCKLRLLQKNEILHLNELQVKQSYQRVFSSTSNLNRAQIICTENPSIVAPNRKRYNFYPEIEKSFLDEILQTIKDDEYDSVVAEIRARSNLNAK